MQLLWVAIDVFPHITLQRLYYPYITMSSTTEAVENQLVKSMKCTEQISLRSKWSTKTFHISPLMAYKLRISSMDLVVQISDKNESYWWAVIHNPLLENSTYYYAPSIFQNPKMRLDHKLVCITCQLSFWTHSIT